MKKALTILTISLFATLCLPSCTGIRKRELNDIDRHLREDPELAL